MNAKILIAAIALAAAAGTALAATDTIYRYTTPRTGHLTIHPAAMAAGGSNMQFGNIVDSVRLSANSGSCFNTGVNLPNGATITRATMYYSKFGASSIVFELVRLKLNDGQTAGVAIGVASANTNARKAIDLPVEAGAAVINNAQYGYGLLVCLNSTDNIFYGAKIAYTYTNAGD
jgi:hypothetical protein